VRIACSPDVRGRPVVVVAALALLAADGAAAAVAPVFTRGHARIGEVVGVLQPVPIGRPAPGARSGIVVYLIPYSHARARAYYGTIIDGPPPVLLARIRLGELAADRNGIWRLSFRVPRVQPGAYTTLVWCKPCGGGNYPHGSVFAGGYLAPNGVLHIVP
jgi:hypothetical protein